MDVAECIRLIRETLRSVSCNGSFEFHLFGSANNEGSEPLDDLDVAIIYEDSTDLSSLLDAVHDLGLPYPLDCICFTGEEATHYRFFEDANSVLLFAGN